MTLLAGSSKTPTCIQCKAGTYWTGSGQGLYQQDCCWHDVASNGSWLIRKNRVIESNQQLWVLLSFRLNSTSTVSMPVTLGVTFHSNWCAINQYSNWVCRSNFRFNLQSVSGRDLFNRIRSGSKSGDIVLLACTGEIFLQNMCSLAHILLSGPSMSLVMTFQWFLAPVYNSISKHL